MSPENCRVYVGNLPDDIRKNEVADIFSPYGNVKAIDLKYGRTRNGTAYAFIEFDHPREAEDAVKACDNMPFHNSHLRVEFTGQPKPRRTSPFPNRTAPVRSEHRVIVLGLPRQASWQDLKDHMRSAGNVGYVLIDDRCRGIVEYETEEGKIRALEKLHRSKFSNPFSTVTIKVYTEDQLRDRQESPSAGRYIPQETTNHEHPRLSRADRSPQRGRSRSPPPRSRHADPDRIRRPDDDRIRRPDDERIRRLDSRYDRRGSGDYPPPDIRTYRREYRDYPRNPDPHSQVDLSYTRRDSYAPRNNDSYRQPNDGFSGFGHRGESFATRNDGYAGSRNDSTGLRSAPYGQNRHENPHRAPRNDYDVSRDDTRLREESRVEEPRFREDTRPKDEPRKNIEYSEYSRKEDRLPDDQECSGRKNYPHVDDAVRALREQRFGRSKDESQTETDNKPDSPRVDFSSSRGHSSPKETLDNRSPEDAAPANFDTDKSQDRSPRRQLDVETSSPAEGRSAGISYRSGSPAGDDDFEDRREDDFPDQRDEFNDRSAYENSDDGDKDDPKRKKRIGNGDQPDQIAEKRRRF